MSVVFCEGFEVGILSDLTPKRLGPRARRRQKKQNELIQSFGYEILETQDMIAIVPKGEYVIEQVNENEARLKRREAS